MFGQATEDECPEIRLFTSLNAVVVGDKVHFNVVAKGGSLKPSELKFEWRSYSGRLSVSRDTTRAVLDTATVKHSWDIVSVDFIDFRRCLLNDSSGAIHIRRKGPYSEVDEFWWWFQLNSERYRAYKMPDYEQWIEILNSRLWLIDPNLTYEFDRDRPDPINTGLIVSYKGKPVNPRFVHDFVARAPKIAGWEFFAGAAK